MTKKTIIIQILIILISLSGCNIKPTSPSKEAEKPPEQTGGGSAADGSATTARNQLRSPARPSAASKPTKPPKTEAEKKALAKTCGEIQDEATCNKNTDCKFYIVCMPADKASEIENDKELQAKLEKAEKTARLNVFTLINKLKRPIKNGVGEHPLKDVYEKLEIERLKLEELPFEAAPDRVNIRTNLTKKRDNALNDLINKMKENDKKEQEERENREKIEQEKIAKKNRKAEEQKNREKAEEEEKERRAREQRAKEQAERDRKNEQERQKLLENNRLMAEQERNNQKRAADEIKKFIEQDIFYEYANKDSLNKNIALLNAEQKQQLIQKVKKLDYSKILKNFSSNLLTSITPSEYSLELFEALVNNKDFKKYYAKDAPASIRFDVNWSINKMVNESTNKDTKDLITTILKNNIFNDLKIGISLDNSSMNYSKLLDIMKAPEDKKVIYDYLEKSVNTETIKYVIYNIKYNKKEYFDNLEAIYKNEFVKNNFKEFTYQIKDLLSLIANDYQIEDRLKIVNLMLKNYLADDLFIENNTTYTKNINKFMLKNVLSLTKDDQAELINYIKNKSSEEEKQKLIELATTKTDIYEFTSEHKNRLKAILTSAGIIN